MSELSYQIKLKILHLLFESTSTIGERNANLDCLLIAPYGKFRFQTCAIYNMHKQNWTLTGRQHRWLQPIHNDLVTNESLNSVYQELIKGLRPFWLGVRAVKSKGAVLEAGQSKITKKQQEEAILIWRPHLGD